MTTQEKMVLDDLLNISAGLSGWEIDFLEDLENRRDGAEEAGVDLTLTDKQADKLHEIARRIGHEE